jgi:hypothetical protein
MSFEFLCPSTLSKAVSAFRVIPTRVDCFRQVGTVKTSSKLWNYHCGTSLSAEASNVSYEASTSGSLLLTMPEFSFLANLQCPEAFAAVPQKTLL